MLTKLIDFYTLQIPCVISLHIHALYSAKVTQILVVTQLCGCSDNFCAIPLLGQEPPKTLRFLERVEKPVPRPPTPAVQCPPAGLEETEQAVVLLQRIIRGRAIQNKV